MPSTYWVSCHKCKLVTNLPSAPDHSVGVRNFSSHEYAHLLVPLSTNFSTLAKPCSNSDGVGGHHPFWLIPQQEKKKKFYIVHIIFRYLYNGWKKKASQKSIEHRFGQRSVFCKPRQ